MHCFSASEKFDDINNKYMSTILSEIKENTDWCFIGITRDF